MAVYDGNKSRFVGHSGSGFDFSQLDEIYNKLQQIRIEKCPVDYIPYTNRAPVWIEPKLVAEIKFSDWTNEKIMRAPIFLRFREDKRPEECIIEEEKSTEKLVSRANDNEKEQQRRTADEISSSNSHSTATQLQTSISSSAATFSNLDKVFWEKGESHPQLTKRGFD